MSTLIITNRNSVWKLLPTWARGTNLFSVIYAIVLIVDAFWDMLVAAVKIRFQGYYSDESIPRIATERKMFQGRSESAASFAGRLSGWWDLAKRSGCFYVMAKELAAYFLPNAARIRIVTTNGTLYTFGTDGSWSISSVIAEHGVSWNWDNANAQWSRFWVLLDNSSLGLTGTDHLVLDSLANVLQPTRLVGSDITADPVALRTIMETYRAPHCHCVNIMPILDETGFWASPPNGGWGQWSARNLNALYWEGTTV
jgi:hypothetical protein